MKVVLFQPQIPQNTGNIVRTCAVTGCSLLLVEPLGFSINDRWLKRAGLDYWEEVKIEVIPHLEELLERIVEGAGASFHLFSSKAKIPYTQHSYGREDFLIFGSETAGLPLTITEKWKEHCVKIPMRDDARCLNLATSVGIGIYEALRRQNFSF